MRILIITSFIIAISLFLACGGANTPSSTGVGGTQCPPTHAGTTAQNICLPKMGCGPDCQIDRPDGGYVFLETGISDPEARRKISERVIAGVAQTIRSAQYHNPTWTNYAATGNYNVWMIKKQADTEAGWPALITNGIKTAGTVINTWRDGTQRAPMYMVLPEPERFDDETYWGYLQNSARNEGEHQIEYANAIGVFISKAVEGDIHPHWSMPPGEEARGFVGSKPLACAPVGMEGPVYIR
jgi:hypothetical protein